MQLLKKFPAFYRSGRFITVLTRALHWCLSGANSSQYIPPHPIYLRLVSYEIGGKFWVELNAVICDYKLLGKRFRSSS
jgi:hypothetical protein